MIQGKSLLGLTLERLAPLSDGAPGGVICVGAEDHRFLIGEMMREANVSGSIILEPCARNTAVAMALAALCASGEQLLLICPADHHIPDAAAFVAMVRNASVCAQQGAIVIFGVVPTFPHTGYGYIERGDARADGGYQVKRFIEKPNAQSAQELLLAGKVFWNAGIFLCTAATLLTAMEQHAPDILSQCRKAMSTCQSDGNFLRPAAAPLQACRAASIDYAVMEHHSQVVVYPFNALWSDVGSWHAVADMCPPDEGGNRVDGQGVVLAAKNTFIHAPHRRVVALGTDDLIIVDTPDALLVAQRSHAEQVKCVVAELEARGNPEALLHRKVQRPWGSYDSIEAGQRFQVKRIVIKPSASISLQKHFHRAEHWIVIRGTAEVTRGKETFLLSENESTYIPLGEVHRLHNPGKIPLEIIEVQSGGYLGEDDIVRLDDNYGRVAASIDDAKRV